MAVYDGSENDDIITGSTANDTIHGLDGNDTLAGGGGDDTIDGGNGFDAASFAEDFANYTLTANTDGSFTVLHNTTGQTTTLVQVEAVQFADQTVRIVNQDPVAVADNLESYFGAYEDTARVIYPVELLDNDSDLDGDTLSIISVGDAVGGTVAIVDGNVVFTPAQNFNGAASFSYTISDGFGGTATATANVAVSAINDAPVGVDDTLATAEDTALVIAPAELLGNDSDVEGDNLSITWVGETYGGSVEMVDGNIVFTPEPNFTGTASFAYIINDGADGFESATAIITVGAVNDAPVAVGESFTIDEDATLVVWPADLLGNDGDLDGDTLSVISVGDAVGGTVEIIDGNAVFTPAANFNGDASFSYTIGDGAGGTATATASVTVNAVNDDPVAADDFLSTGLDTALFISPAALLGNDSDAEGGQLAIASFGGESNCVVQEMPDSQIGIFPYAGFIGTASFQYLVSDGQGGYTTATATIEVTAPPNDAPLAQSDTLATERDTELVVATGDLLANDYDQNVDFLTITAISGATNCTAVLTPFGEVSITPDAGFHGVASFDYTVDDGRGGTSTTTVLVEIGLVNHVPMASEDWLSTSEDVPLVIDPATLLVNDFDFNGDALSISEVGNAVGGTVALVDGNVVFTPEANFSGAARFDYTVSDGAGGFATATVNVDVWPENDAPVAVNDQFNVELVDGQIAIDAATLLANDSDPDGPLPAIGQITNVVGGEAWFDGYQVRFTPAVDFTGTGSFDYTVFDNFGVTSTATANFVIGPVNHAPTGNQDVIVPVDRSHLPVVISAAELLANDVDPDGDILSITGVSDAANGTVEFDSAGDIVFTPAAGFSGAAYFYYTISDPAGATSMQRVIVDVPPDPAVSATVVLANTHETTLDDGEYVNLGNDVTALSGGGHVVVWENSGIVHAQIMGQDGNPLGAATQVSTTSGATRPNVAALADGGFAVCWSNGNGYARRFNADGSPNGGTVEITPAVPYSQNMETLTALPNGDLVVTYSSYNQDGSSWGVFGRVIAADGSLGGEFQVNTPVSGSQQFSSTTALASGGFVVSYQCQGTYPAPTTTRFQVFNADGTKAGDDRVLVGSSSTVSLAAHGTGFIAVWSAWGGSNYAQTYAADGTALGGPVQVSQGAGWGGTSIKALALDDGGTLLWWTEHEGGVYTDYDVVSQRFDANGVAVTEPFRIHSTAATMEMTAQASQRADGSIAFVWAAFSEGGDRTLKTAVMEEGIVYQGNSAANTIGGGSGNDLLVGGIRQDTYLAGLGTGADVVDNRSHGADGDRVLFGTGVAAGQLWFQREGDSLKVSVIGTGDSVSVADWYQTDANHVAAFQTAGGLQLGDTQVETLVQAMASFSPPPLGQTELTAEQHQALDTVIAANWQSA